MTDVFKEVRERVTARAAAERYGFHPDRSGFVRCPFHREKTGSLKLYPDGRYHCFGCGADGDAIDFTARLHGLSPLEAVRRLDTDFCLRLPLDKPLTELERRQARQEQRRREQLRETWEAFQQWRRETVRQLDSVFLEAHLAQVHITVPEDLDRLAPAQVEAIQWEAWAEHLSDLLAQGPLEEQMQVFRQRKEVQARCSRILNGTQMKSGRG